MSTSLPLDWYLQPPPPAPPAPPRPGQWVWLTPVLLVLLIIFGQPAKALLIDDPSSATGEIYAATVNRLAEDGIILISRPAIGIGLRRSQYATLSINDDLLDPAAVAASGERAWLNHCRGVSMDAQSGAIKSDGIGSEMLGWLTGWRNESVDQCATMIALFKSKTFLAEDMATGCNDESWACADSHPTILASLRELRIDPDSNSTPAILFNDEERVELVLSPTSNQAAADIRLRLISMADNQVPMPNDGTAGDLQTWLVGANANLPRPASAFCFRQQAPAQRTTDCGDGVGVWLLGNHVLLTMGPRFARAGGTVTVDGQKLAFAGSHDDSIALLRENQRAILAFAAGDGGSDDRVAMRLVRSRPTLDLQPSLASLAHDLAMADPKGGEPLVTTLDEELQATVQQLLDAKAGTLTRQLEAFIRDRRQAGAAEPEPDFRASITLMDASTGDIRSLATWPYLPEQVRHGGQSPTAAAITLTRSNANFIRMPIGSTAKVPFAAAIIAAYPGLIVDNPCGASPEAERGLRRLNDAQWHDYADDTPADGQPRQEVDWTTPWMQAPNVQHQCDGPNAIGFRSFIAQSSNAYAINLMMHTRPVGRIPYRLDRPQPGEAESSSSLFLRYLWQMACVAPIQLKENLAGDNDWGWQSEHPEYCSKSLFPGRAFDDRRHSLVTRYDRVNLDAQDIDNSTALPDFLMNILGGSRSTWTTINLAEAYSRIVTNTRVQARLISGPPIPPGTIWPAGDQRDELLEGMAGVIRVDQNGTARGAGIENALGGEFSNYRVYAKTGTPRTVLRSASGTSWQPLQQYLDAGCKLWVGQRNGRAVLRFEPSTNSRCPDSLIAPYRDNAGPGARAVAQELYNLERRERRVFALPQQFNFEYANGHVFVMVICPPGQPMAGCKTIAINLQWRPDSDRIAAAMLASELLRQPAIRRWLRAAPATAANRTAS